MPEVYYARRVSGAGEAHSSSFLNVEQSVREPCVESGRVAADIVPPLQP